MNNEQEQDTKRKPYDKPRLIVYGGITQLTMQSTMTALGDNPPMHSNRKS